MSTPPKRFSMRSLLRELLDVFNLEKGLLYTIKVLILSPGKSLNTHLYEDRTRLMAAFKFIFLMVAIATFLNFQVIDYNSLSKDVEWVGYKEGLRIGSGGKYTEAELDAKVAANSKEAEAAQEKIDTLVQENFNLLQLINLPIISMICMWFFGRKFNYAEHLVINAYVLGIGMLIYVLVLPLIKVGGFTFMTSVLFLASLVYSVWAYGKIYKQKLWPSIWKTFLVSSIAIIFYLIILTVFVLAYLSLTVPVQ